MSTTSYIPTVEAIKAASGVLEEILTPTPFQKNNNLTADGNAGSATIKKLKTGKTY
mgnify:CR=1 FL=1